MFTENTLKWSVQACNESGLYCEYNTTTDTLMVFMLEEDEETGDVLGLEEIPTHSIKEVYDLLGYG